MSNKVIIHQKSIQQKVLITNRMSTISIRKNTLVKRDIHLLVNDDLSSEETTDSVLGLARLKDSVEAVFDRSVSDVKLMPSTSLRILNHILGRISYFCFKEFCDMLNLLLLYLIVTQIKIHCSIILHALNNMQTSSKQMRKARFR